MHTPCNMQMDCDVEMAVLNISENHGYLATVVADSSAQVFLTAERCLLGSPNNATSVIIALMGMYFSFTQNHFILFTTFCFGHC